jgi:hypothetical protein
LNSFKFKSVVLSFSQRRVHARKRKNGRGSTLLMIYRNNQ